MKTIIHPADRQTASPNPKRPSSVDATQPAAPQSLVIKIWLETPDKAEEPVWRGRVTHVETGEQIYVRSLRELFAVVVRFLLQMGAKVPLIWRMMARLERARTGNDGSD